MNRDEFIDLLARLVADDVLTEDKAKSILLQFDAGALADGWQLPLAASKAIRGHDEESEEAALVLLLVLLAKRNTELNRSLPRRVALDLVDVLQDRFDVDTAALTERLTSGDITLKEWHAQMLKLIEAQTAMNMLLGNRRGALTKAQQERMVVSMREQSGFLQRFADHIAVAVPLLVIPFTAAYIANRAALYGGVGRGEFFRASEEAGLEGDDLGAGWIIQYIARDDRGTCSPCLSAQGYYLPGRGPMPGVVCLGRSNCRCRRVPVYDPAIYASLQ